MAIGTQGQAGGGDRGRPRTVRPLTAERDAGCADEVRDRRYRRLPGRASLDRRRSCPAKPAERGGLKPGDIVLTFNGQTITFRQQLIEADREAPEPDRGLRRATRDRAAAVSVDADAAGEERPASASAWPTTFKHRCSAAPSQAAKHEPASATTSSSGLIFQTLVGLLTRETSPRQLMGPVAHRAAVGRVGRSWAGSRCSV